jgi:hypothetical protein
VGERGEGGEGRGGLVGGGYDDIQLYIDIIILGERKNNT